MIKGFNHTTKLILSLSASSSRSHLNLNKPQIFSNSSKDWSLTAIHHLLMSLTYQSSTSI